MMRFGLIGHPLEGSGSPELFSKAYGGRWPYDLIEGAGFEQSWQRFLADYQAINITAPFKEKAFAKILLNGSVPPECEAIGAVNIAVKTPDGLRGYNSDYLALRKILLEEGFGEGNVVVVAGFGGAGKAAAAAARSIGMDVTVCNRTPHPGTRPLDELPLLAGIADIVLYTLPVAVDGVSCPVLLEANYRSPGMEGSAQKYIPGTRWLLEQARTGYALMTGEEPKL